MADHKQQPSALAIWLGIADNTFTRQKTVKFGDASAVNSGRLWSIVTVVVLVVAWWIATVGGLVDPIFWPPLEGSLYPVGRPQPGQARRGRPFREPGRRGLSQHLVLGAHLDLGQAGAARGVLRRPRRDPPRLRDGPQFGGARASGSRSSNSSARYRRLP